MSIRTAKVALRGTFVALIGMSFAVLNCDVSAQVEDASPARMATFEDAGQTSFALSIGPERQQSQRASDVIVFVDTSASQTGLFKKDSVELLRGLVRNLSGDDRIQIFAVDLEAVALHSGFANPLDEKVQLAIENLNNRVALGSTDMQSMIDTAISSFKDDGSRNRNVIYIGDGISRAGMLYTKSFTKAVEKLAADQISVSSFAIGPERNIALLAALANHSGGNIVVDTDADDSVDHGAVELAKTVHGSVFWPTDGTLPENIAEIYPAKCPPMRTDRDTILVGSVTDGNGLNIELSGTMDGRAVTKAWRVAPEATSKKFAFLPKMLTEARKDGGVSLPTVGSAGLVEYARLIDENQVDLELLSDNKPTVSGTAVIASAAKQSDSRVALPARFAARQQDDPFGGGGSDDPFGGSSDDPFGGSGGSGTKDSGVDNSNPFGGGSDTKEPAPTPAPVDDPVTLPEVTEEPATPAGDPFGEVPSEDPGGLGPIDDSGMEVAPSQQQQPAEIFEQPIEVTPIPGMGSGTKESVPESINMIGSQQSDISKLIMQTESEYIKKNVVSLEDRDRIINEKLTKQVQYETERALQELSTDPSAAIDRLKNMLEVVDQTPELTQGTLSELRHRLESSLQSATRRKLDYDERQQLSSRNQSTVDSIRNDISNFERSEEKITRLVSQYRALMREGNFSVAEEVADSIHEAFPHDADSNSISERARIARTHFELLDLRREKERLFAHSIREIYRSAMPIPGDPPLVFPDAEEWIAKKAARAKYQNVRLAGGANERRIIDQLEKPIDLVYDAEPFGDVRETLSRELGINIVIDSNLEGVLEDDTEVTANLVGIPLGKGLRTMLKSIDATYVVKDEVLLIISIDDELEPDYLVTDVYNVGDLVAPRSNPLAGIGSLGGGAFGGGGQGGRGQGGQGGGFGQGGGGGFGQGGGGAFCIQDQPAGLFIGGTDAPQAKPQAKTDSAVSFKPGNLIEVDPGQDADQAWDTYFKNNQPSSKSIRATVREMVGQQRHEEIVALINSAIRNNQSASWMFQALGLSMQILGRPNTEIERAVMSAVDLSDSVPEAMFAAIYMSKNGMLDRSLQLLEDLATSNPSLVQPFEAGLGIAETRNHVDGMRWSSVGVLAQEWPEKPELAKRARYAAAAVKSKLQKAGKTAELADFEATLADAKHRDCFIEVSWTGDADIDIFVEEPGGTICSRLNPRTSAGGVYYGDAYSNGKTASGKMSEQYVLPKGFSGDYRLIIRRMMGEVTSGKVNVAIHNHYQSDQEAGLEKAVKLDPKGAIVLFKLNNGRRTDDLDQHTLETLVRKKMAAKQTAVAQHMASFVTKAPTVFAQSTAGDDIFVAQENPIINPNNFGAFAPRVVGYSPEISQIPTGTGLTVNHATTADRLFVLISTTPQFSVITEVSTFNILGDADNATGATGGVGGGGGFGGGFGGGGGTAF